MDTLLNWVAGNGAMLIGTAAVLCGVAIMSILMARTSKRRQDELEAQE